MTADANRAIACSWDTPRLYDQVLQEATTSAWGYFLYFPYMTHHYGDASRTFEHHQRTAAMSRCLVLVV